VGPRRAGAGAVTIGVFEEEPYTFGPAERPLVAGGPARAPYRVLAGAPCLAWWAMLLGLSGGLDNRPGLGQPPLSARRAAGDASEAAWISVAYSMTYVSMNLLLVRFRQQFGLRLFAMIALITFCLVILIHVMAQDLGGAILVHRLRRHGDGPFTPCRSII